MLVKSSEFRALSTIMGILTLLAAAGAYGVLYERRVAAEYRRDSMDCVELDWPVREENRIDQREVCTPSLPRLLANPAEYEGRFLWVVGSVAWSEREAFLATSTDLALCPECATNVIRLANGPSRLPPAGEGVVRYHPLAYVAGRFRLDRAGAGEPKLEVGVIELERDVHLLPALPNAQPYVSQRGSEGP